MANHEVRICRACEAGNHDSCTDIGCDCWCGYDFSIAGNQTSELEKLSVACLGGRCSDCSLQTCPHSCHSHAGQWVM